MEASWRHLDAELMRRWRRGEPAAFEALVRRWQEPMARMMARLSHRPELVPDLCQEVFLRVYLAGPRYREKAAFSTWLYRIALNVARDAWRRSRHKPLPLADHEPAAPLAPAEAVCEQHELARIVALAIAELPPLLREVLVLHHYEAMNFEEMSRILKVPASTLKSRFAAALGRLRTRLQHLGFSHEETDG